MTDKIAQMHKTSWVFTVFKCWKICYRIEGVSDLLILSTSTYTAVSVDPVSCQRRPRSACTKAQADQGLHFFAYCVKALFVHCPLYQYLLQGEWLQFQGRQLCQNFFWNVVYSKWKEFALLGVDTFSEGMVCRNANRKPQKLSHTHSNVNPVTDCS